MRAAAHLGPRSLLAAALLLVGPSCPESSAPQDAGVDAPDRGLTLLDQAPGEPPQFDQGADLPPDGPAPDLIQQDWGPLSDAALSKATVLYTVTANTGSFGLRTVSTDGTGAPAPVPDWTGYVDLDPLKLAGAPQEPAVNSDVPHVTASHHQDFQGIRLPGALGTLYYFHQKLLGTSGLLLVQPDGGLKVLLEVDGVYTDTLASPIGLSPDGKIGAVVVGTSQVLLFRTDGTTFSNGQSWIDVTDVGSQLQIKPHSLTPVQGWLYCVGASASNEVLLRAPLDGSATLTQVTLPASDGAAPVSVGDRLTASPDQSFVLVAAGASSTAQDLYTVASQSGAATNITGAATYLVPRADCFGPAGCGQLAISPAGKLVAYIANVQGNAEVYLAKTDGSKTTVHVTSGTHFQPQVNVISNLYFADEDNLLFMAGISLYDLDLYRWDNKASKAANLTGYGSTSAPFDGHGNFYTKGAWASPNGKWLYWIEYRYYAGFTDLRGVDLTSWTVVQTTLNAELSATSDALAACPQDGKVYFSAEANPGHNNREVWVFDQNQGTAATKLTTMSVPLAYWYVYNLLVADDCSRVTWTGGGSYVLQQLWIMNAGGSAKPITKVPMYYDRGMAFTPDTQTVVFASGGSEGSATLKAVPAVPNASPTTLDTTAGYVHIFAVY